MDRFLLLGLLAFGTFTLSCAKTDSSNVKTAAFYAEYAIKSSTANSSSAVCSASFRVESGGTFLDLNNGDRVTCNGLAMTRTELLGIVNYSVSLPATVGGTYTFILTRSGEAPYTATVTLPEIVVPTAPSVGSVFLKGNVLSVSWTPSENATDSMILSTSKVTSGDSKCPDIAAFDDSAPESGVGSFTSSQMSLPVNGASGACGMDIIFQRRRAGTMPSGLKGSIFGIQESSVGITLN
jgi:hypothetical protein